MPYPYAYDEEAQRKEQQYQPPKLKTDRKMWKLMLFHCLTFGTYGIFFFIPFSFDLDRVAPKPDRTKTMNFLFAYILSLLTFSIVMIIWHYQIAKRIEEALEARQIEYDFKTSAFWLWYVLGSFFIVGPFIYFHKLCQAMNLLCASYNENPTPQTTKM